MRPLFQHAPRSLLAHATSIARRRTGYAALRCAAQTPVDAGVCWSCQIRASSVALRRRDESARQDSPILAQAWRRQWSSSRTLREERTPHEPPKSPSPPETAPAPASPSPSPSPLPPPVPPSPQHTPEPTKAEASIVSDATPKNPDKAIKRVPAEALPSHREGQRWDLSKRVQEMMDDLLPKLALVTQKVNTYTGTDYSSIEALKREIKEQGKP